ncbi:hypothetical protein SAMN02745166_01503 [Prosthecobacter debontii]|uniref:Sulfotransferase family protein n=1 Tax=Prosthecobacter debontii TaxID=48467 RepID=A0A1T4XH94_9BACT|nr:hypothetical protein [Prosthecobacter debontii]SKA88889.1 hypothetical protein SAMN02745166_01503 [Prosthecobacter debontii]
METEQPFFILGLPRTRTAWLSTVLSMCGRPCYHEGMRGFASFEDYAQNREVPGDADPTLIYWTARLLEQWPDARFVVVSRNGEDALRDLIAASPPELEQSLKEGWASCMLAFSMTRDLLRGNPNAMFLEFADLTDNALISELVAHCGGAIPSPSALSHWQRMRVTSHIAIEGMMDSPRALAPPSQRVRAADICDVTGLEAVMYDRQDFEMVSYWWRMHSGSAFHEASLPPLGVIVKLNGEPAAALWCYESFGVSVAELTFPVTRPGLSVKDARRALIYAVSCLVAVAGKGHEPEATFTTFKVLAPQGLARFLVRMGFKPMLTERKPMILTL